MTLLEKLLEKTGQKWLSRDVGEDGKRHYIRAISETNELRRILALPMRSYECALPEISKLVTAELKTPKGIMKLWPIQAAALADIAYCKGALCPIKVGRGKTLISLLAPSVLEAERPLLLVPANLRDKTLSYDLPELKKHWKIHENLKVVGYSEISLEKNKDLLFEINPDVIICDECHYLRNPRSGRTRRVTRYLKSFPQTAFIGLSGTVAQRSFTDWAHLCEWALHAGSPLPRNWNELNEWSLYFDATVPDESRPLPGALRKLCSGSESIQEAWKRRFNSTPGIVVSDGEDVSASLVLNLNTKPITDLNIQEALNRLRNRWETPDGDPIINAVDMQRHIRTLALGFYYVWEPKPPESWLSARRSWKKYVREVLKHNRRGLDTELQVWNESKRNPHEEWIHWEDIKNTFKPNSIAVWVSDTLINQCSEWLRDNDGIVWTLHMSFGERLAKCSGYPYFGAGDDSINGTQQTKIIASIRAHGEGKNLQRYSRALVAAPPGSGKTWEQLLGRMHRDGQQADEVVYDVLLHEPELVDCLKRAYDESEYIEKTYGNRQKLRYAAIIENQNER